MFIEGFLLVGILGNLINKEGQRYCGSTALWVHPTEYRPKGAPEKGQCRDCHKQTPLVPLNQVADPEAFLDRSVFS
jgi:hypothetical protein